MLYSSKFVDKACLEPKILGIHFVIKKTYSSTTSFCHYLVTLIPCLVQVDLKFTDQASGASA